MDALLNLLDTYGVALLFVIILLKEIGVPVPVPGDLLMIVAILAALLLFQRQRWGLLQFQSESQHHGSGRLEYRSLGLQELQDQRPGEHTIYGGFL